MACIAKNLVQRSSFSMRKRFQQCSSSSNSFQGFGLHPDVVEKLSENGLTQPLDIQSKTLPCLLDGANVVVNAETGSGKTLCFLLPVIQGLVRLTDLGRSIPTPYSIVLVPTPHLAHQIEGVFKQLSDHPSKYGCSVLYGGNRLMLKANTSLLIATPSSLHQYNVEKICRGVRILCVDEADVLLTGGEKEPTWNILNTIKMLYKQDSHKTDSSLQNTLSEKVPIIDEKFPARQLIFTAATLPSGGSQTVHSLLKRWLPKNSLFINTENTHQVLDTADISFVNICGDGNAQKERARKFEQLRLDLKQIKGDLVSLPKVLVFCNTVTSVEDVYEYLVQSSRVETTLWWNGKFQKLHKKIDTKEREEIFDGFRSDRYNVLISTDLASRGLDFPQVAAVLLFDFPGNSADFLHRAGRTARAGKSGKVISYVGSADMDLAQEIKDVVQSDGARSFATIFSRNKMLRRKIKRRKS